jgi:hypothetical protein
MSMEQVITVIARITAAANVTRLVARVLSGGTPDNHPGTGVLPEPRRDGLSGIVTVAHRDSLSELFGNLF